MKTMESKQPYEEYHVNFDLSAELASMSDTISSFDVTVFEYGTENETTSTMYDLANSSNTTDVVSVWIMGGEDGKLYKYTLRVETAGGARLEKDALLPVRDE